MLKKGEKIHVVHRQFFEKDAKRHFVGEVEEYETGVIRAVGYLFAMEGGHGFMRRSDKRIRLIPICGHTLINILPSTIDLENVVYENERGFIRISDGSNWHLDISFG